MTLSFASATASFPAQLAPSAMEGCICSALTWRSLFAFSTSTSASLRLRCSVARSASRFPASFSLSSATSMLRRLMASTYWPTWRSTLTTLRVTTLVLIFVARSAYTSVLCVSSKCALVGAMHTIITVLQLPPSENLSSRVSLLLRYGTCRTAPPLSHSALMQFPSASSDLLMFAPSTMRCPMFVVAAARSLPARSMIESVPIVRCSVMEAVRGAWVTWTCRTACERELVSLACVGLCVRRELPRSTICFTSSAFAGRSSVSPTTFTVLSSRICRPPRGVGVPGSARRSRISSL